MRQSQAHLAWLPPVPAELRESMTCILNRFEAEIKPALNEIPTQMIHNDDNDNNILVDENGVVSGLIDYGDMIYGHRITELAIACCYTMCDQADPIAAVMPLVAGYHSVLALPIRNCGCYTILF